MDVEAVARWKELSALYERADELDAAARGAWLDALRHEHHPLLADLERMLAARASARETDFLGTLPPLPAPAPRLPAATRLGPWTLLEPLGEGGMAEVWLAERADGAFRRRVAVKLLHRHVGRAQREAFAQRFDRERDILASLHHPHVAALLDAGVTPDGQPWLALEYVQGAPITDDCDRRRLPVAARVRLFQQVLLAVQHAHANLVVHRDLKPANILVAEDGNVKLLDFGIAKLAETEGAALDATELTQLAGRPLTPTYAAPEQLTGQPLTTACDVYALGVVLYELLAGQRPYELKAATPAQVEQAILEADPRPPSRRELTPAIAAARATTPKALRRTLAADLDAIVLRALAKRPQDRYASADALRADLQHWLDGKPVTARAPSRLYALTTFARRHRVGVALGGAAVLGLAGLAVTATVLGLKAREESARAVAARDFMVDIFRKADPEKARGVKVTAGEILDAGRRDVGQRLRGQPDLQIELLGAINGIQRDMGDWLKADDSAAELVALLRQRGREREARLAQVDRAEGLVYAGEYPRAAALLAAVPAAAGDVELASRHAEVSGWVANAQGRWDDAQAAFERGLEGVVRLHGDDSQDALRLRRSLAMLAVDRGRHGQALRWHEELARQVERMPGLPEHERLAIANERLLALHGAGRYAQVHRDSGPLLQQCLQGLGPHAPPCRTVLRMRLLTALRLGLADAVPATELDLLRVEARDTQSPTLAVWAQQVLLRLFAARGEADRADTEGRALQALLASQGEQGLSPRMIWASRYSLIEAELRLGRHRAAQAQAERALQEGALLREAPEHARLVRALLGVAQLQGGQRAAGQANLESALAELVQQLGSDHPLPKLLRLNLLVASRAAELVARCRDDMPALALALGDGSPVYRHADRLLGAPLAPGRDPRPAFF